MAKLKPDHLFDLTFISDPTLNFDGTRAAAVHTTIVQPEDEDKAPRYKSNIYLYDLKTNEETQFTQSNYSDTQPRFSPDGTNLAFLSRREEDAKQQLFLIPLNGGEAKQLTNFKSGVSSFTWHPEGQSLALISRGDWEDDIAKKKTARTVDRMQYKYDGLGFKPTEPAQIYTYDLSKDKMKKVTDLVSDPSSLAFSSDGKRLYFVAASTLDEADQWLGNIHALTLKSGKTKPLLPKAGMVQAITPSPDGERLAFFAPTEWDNFGSSSSLWLTNRKGGEPERLTIGADATPTAMGDSRYGSYPNKVQWNATSSVLTFNSNEAGRSALAKFSLTTGKVTPIHTGDRIVTAFDFQNNVALFTAETPNTPGELFVQKGSTEMQLSSVNTKLVKKFDLKKSSKPITIKAKDKTPLTYWKLEPSKPRKDKAVVVQVHGGPHTNYGYGFYFEFHLLAAAGYTVVYGNPRGSSSFGNDFATAVQRNYGAGDADDVLAITRHALKRHKDPSAPVHLTGGSYGGFMTNWLVGHTDEFSSAVTQRSICNWLSFYGASDIGYKFTEQEQGGNPWDDLETLWNQSPLKYAANVTTPTLIIHAEEDHRCPIEQAEQFYIALKRLGNAPTKFIRFPEEGHELSRSGRPDRRVERLEAMLDWFRTYS